MPCLYNNNNDLLYHLIVCGIMTYYHKYNNKYRIQSIRLANWDYRSNGAYFITICTKNRIHYFGEIKNGKMQLSNIGIIADILWCEIKYHIPGIQLREFIVMPNHIHGILILNNKDLREERIMTQLQKVFLEKNKGTGEMLLPP